MTEADRRDREHARQHIAALVGDLPEKAAALEALRIARREQESFLTGGAR